MHRMIGEYTISIGMLLAIVCLMANLMILVPFAIGHFFDKVFGISRTSFWLNFSKTLIMIAVCLLIGFGTVVNISKIFIH